MSMLFNATWSPGPDAVAGMQIGWTGSHRAALVMYLDRDSLASAGPASRAELPGFVRFLRQLRDGAEELVTYFDQFIPPRTAAPKSLARGQA
jgi:hypothetical protein